MQTHASADIDRLSGDTACGIGGQKQGQIGHLFWLDEALLQD